MERRTLSAHEISKYEYCPYQWYYERLYGRKELRRLCAERKERLHLEKDISSRFQKGEAYHRRSYVFLQWKRRLWKIVVLLFVAAAVGGYVWARYGGMG